MSKYGFDLDGVLSRPALAQMANDLFDAGHEVYVVTGGLAETGEWTIAARKERLVQYGVRYTELIRCIDADINQIGRLKGLACEAWDISLLIDDSYPYLQGVGTASNVERLLVL